MPPSLWGQRNSCPRPRLLKSKFNLCFFLTFFLFLILNVFPYHFLVQTYGVNTIPVCPEMIAIVRFVSKLSRAGCIRGERRVVMSSASMAGRDYLCRIANAIGDAISNEKKYQCRFPVPASAVLEWSQRWDFWCR